MTTDTNRKPNLVRSFISTTLGTLAICGGQFVAPVLAQEQPAAPAGQGSAEKPVVIQEVTVTGSRIKRAELEAQSPMVTVDSEQLESRAGLNIESYLNQLPAYNPATTPTNGGQIDVQASPVNTVGISTISLRGFGPNRSLVLVDGHRTTPVNALMVTDINSIPSSMIERVEIISGGASAVYGADAIGGVTNFILRKNFQGLQVDVQDSITQAGDGNELRATALLGTKISDGRGNLIMGAEYYDRDAAYRKNHSFYSNAWNDPTVGGADFFVFGYNGYNPVAAAPTVAAMNAIFPNRSPAFLTPAAAATCAVPPNALAAYSLGNPCTASTGLRFNADGTLFDLTGPIGTSGFTGPTSGNGYGLQNVYDPTQPNTNGTYLAADGVTRLNYPDPSVSQALKWNNPNGLISGPQTRYSFFANGTFDITEKVQFFANARFATSRTNTVLFPANASFGWEANVPYNAATDSPINPALFHGDIKDANGNVISPSNLNDAALMKQVADAFRANPTNNPYINPGFIPTGTAGAQHPVPWQLALLLNSRTPSPFLGTLGGGPYTCDPTVSVGVRNPVTGVVTPQATSCTQAPTTWVAETYPLNSFASRSTVDTSTEFTIETGLRFPIVSDWTGELYYSRGQTTAYNLAYGDNSLQRWRDIIATPDYGRNVIVSGNADGASKNFGTTVPTTCGSGYYDTLFSADARPTQDCLDAVTALLQTQTQIQQDIVEANFQGSLFKLPAGDVSLALGYQWRRDSAQFLPDGLQSTNSFTDQVIGVYPTGSLDAMTTVRDGYAEFFLPVVSDLGLLRKLNLDIGGRYSAYGQTDNTTTFKVNMDAQFGRSIKLRGGYNRATRAPNLGELFLNTQEIFGGGAAYGDPCSVRSQAPFGAGGADVDRTAAPVVNPDGTTSPFRGTPAVGESIEQANSTYLICKALMGQTGSDIYYGVNNIPGVTTNQAGAAVSAAFAWLNEEGNPNLKSETADTWTAGLVFSQLGDGPLLRGLTASIDYWRVDIANAIGLNSVDYANYLCYGTKIVTTAAEAAAQAATPDCQTVSRNLSSGAQTTALLRYSNQGRISTSGVDLDLNWIVALSDIGIKVPGSLSISSQDSYLNFYRTKTSPAAFDVTTDWKGSLGPTLAGTNPGAYSYRLFTSISYFQPAFSVNLRWRFLPSVNSALRALNNAKEENNRKVEAAGSGTILSYTPDTTLAAPAYSVYDLSFTWNVNSVLQLRGGINNLLDTDPAITGATAGYPVGTNLSAVCNGRSSGCVNPVAYSLGSSGAGTTNGGFYDVYGRTFFLGFKAQF